jgi:flagellar hook-associated protein 1 FlgK
VSNANGLLQQIANINTQVAGMPANAAAASLLDQRDAAIDQLAKLMDIRVVPGNGNEVDVFTSSGLQLAGTMASTLSFNSHGTLIANSQWNADPTKSGVGTITLTGPSGGTTDLVATNAIRSGQIGAYLAMRDRILPLERAEVPSFAEVLPSSRRPNRKP